MNLSPAVVEQVSEALRAVKTAAQISPELAGDAREELVTVADELAADLAAERPNRLRISQLAAGIATTIQTIGSMRAAYEMLQVALRVLGIVLS